MTRASDDSPRISPPTVLAIVLFLLVGVAWGGATTPAAQAAMLGGLGLLWLLAPARRLPPRGFVLCGAGLVLLAATAWLPEIWFAVRPWQRLWRNVGIDLPPTLSPQPWVSAEACVWLVAGLGWVAWLAGQVWDSRRRGAAVRGLVAGLTLIAAVALAAWKFRLPVPGWFPDHGFGPFPNRNHTGHVFAIAGVLALGCAGDAARRARTQSIPWLLCVAILLVALAVNYSRGGLLLFLGGTILWFAFEAWRKGSWPVLVVGGSVVLALASLVLIFGGAVAARFAGGADSEVGFRILIWRDTLALIHALPWCGAGLGNFRVFFPLFRHASINQQTVLHPESDWLLLVAEMGWLAVPLALGAIGSMLRGALPLTDGSHRRLRAAALAAALAAMLHAIVDVPEHRVGSALVALFALVLARRDTPPTADSRGVVILSRLAGLAALVVAVLLWRLPDDAGRAEQLSQAERYADSEAAANRALARAPLDWRVYFTRAGERASRGLILEAVADFRRARTLEPTYAQIPLDEGLFWRTVQPGLALDAWSEAVHRLLPPEDEDIYNVILNEAPDSPPFREQLLKMAHGRPALQLRWFQFVPAAEARAHLEEIAAVSAQFSPAQSDAFEHRMRELSAPAPP